MFTGLKIFYKTLSHKELRTMQITLALDEGSSICLMYLQLIIAL